MARTGAERVADHRRRRKAQKLVEDFCDEFRGHVRWRLEHIQPWELREGQHDYVVVFSFTDQEAKARVSSWAIERGMTADDMLDLFAVEMTRKLGKPDAVVIE